MSRGNVCGFAPGARVELEVGDLAYGGAGVAREEGFVFLVEGALPGERVGAEITSVSRRFARARALEILRASPDRIDPPCPHDAVCGGCAYQALAYPAELEAKRDQVIQILERIGRFASPSVCDVIPASHPLGYRRRMRYALPLTQGAGPGLHARVDPAGIVEIPRCLLAADRIQAAYLRLLEDLRPLPSSQRPRHMELQFGSLSDSLVAWFSGEAAPSPALRRLASIWCGADGLLQGVLYQPATPRRRSIADRPLLLSGMDQVEEKLGEFRLRIPAGSFFQANPPLAADIFERIAEHVEGSASILELYAGVGALTLFLARKDRILTAVEGNASSLQAARENARSNGFRTIEWMASDVRLVMAEWSRLGRTFESVVLDPPRAGLPAEVCRRLARMAARRIVYLSCDPSTLARDLRLVVDQGEWTLEKVLPVDFFPQTAAIECVAFLKRG